MISSLGLIEVVGLVGAVEAGDTAVKAANVRLLGYELTKGGGMVTVKIEGEVSAVKAAVDAAVMAAEKLTTVVSHLVIARPSEEVAKMIESTEEECQCSCEETETETPEIPEEKTVAEHIVEEKIEVVEVVEEIETPLKKKIKTSRKKLKNKKSEEE
ncbi:BMC domain-containing protein [Fusobacterium ulcerans]|uniref:BMC domain-containing protein n=1 Tax=Fusobacterium ulcerans TaxID=861 RepID=UPI003097D8B8